MEEIKYTPEDDIPLDQIEYEERYLDYEDVVLKEAIDSVTGMGPDGEPNAIFDGAIVHIGQEGRKEKYHYSFVSAKIKMISFVSQFVVVEIDFMNPHSTWIKKCLDLVDDFHSITDKSEYSCVFTVINRYNSVNMHFSFVNPLISCLGYSPESKANTLVKLVFHAALVDLLPNDLSYDSIRASAYREAEIEEQEEEKRAERELADQAAMEAINAGTPLEDDFLGMSGSIRASGTLKNADKHFRSSEEDESPSVNPYE